MQRNTRSYTLVRTVILASATLAIVGVLFAIYQSMAGPPPKRRQPAETATDASADMPSQNGESKPGVPVGQGAEATAGQDNTIVLYSSDSDQAFLELTTREWTPDENQSGLYNVKEPEIRIRTPEGQLAQITADSGLFELTKRDAEKYEPRRGTLMGNVLIRVDRLNTEQRAALPEAEQNDPGPERLVTMHLDSVEFDLENARLQTAGRFSLSAAEGSIEGRGLALRYNEVDSSIESLRIEEEGRIHVKGLGRLFKFDLPGEAEVEEIQEDEQNDAPAVAETMLAATQSTLDDGTMQPAPQPGLSDDDVPVLQLAKEKPERQRPPINYRAVFNENVRVRQVEGGEVTGDLAAGALELVFGFGQQQRDAARSQALAPTARAKQDAVGNLSDEQQVELTVDWAGPLVLTAVDPAEDGEGETGGGTQIIASGGDVRLVQAGRGSVHCGRLIFQEDQERAWLYGDADTPVVIESADGASIAGREMTLDMQAGTALITGPGRMADPRTRTVLDAADQTEKSPDRGAEIRFGHEVNVTFATTTVTKTDPETGESIERRRQYLSNAVFHGDVVMRQAGDSIAGQRIELKLGPPRSAGSFADNIEQLHGEGGVHLVHGEDSVQCERIEVELGLDEGGRIAPRRARAYQNVAANRGPRSITADDTMIVELRSYRVPRDPWDINKARAEALRRGVDPETVDWEKQRTKYENEDRFRPGLLHLLANGQVEVRDPAQNLQVSTTKLDCTFKDGERIDRAEVIGTDAAPAHVELEDFSITGREVYLDVSAESAEVPGPGRLTFLSTRDLDGRELDESVPVAVTWGESMTFNGVHSRAFFTGSVHAVTSESKFDCGELTVDFAERTAASAQADRPATPKVDWWILTPAGRAYPIRRPAR